MTSWAATVLCTVDDVNKRIKGMPFAAKDSTQFQNSANEKILEIKDRMQDQIQIWLTKKFPNTAEDWITTWLGIYRQKRQQVNAEFAITGNNTIVQFPSGDLVDFNLQDFLTTTQGVNPQTFFKSGDPLPTDYAGTARNGAVYVDLSNDNLWENRGTLATPNWQLLIATGLIDFILNPTILKRAAVSGAIWLMLEEGVLGLQAVNANILAVFVDKTIPRWNKYYMDDLSTALQLLQVDESGDGIISNYERSRSSKKNWIA